MADREGADRKLPIHPLPRDLRSWLFAVKSRLAGVKDIGPECVELLENHGEDPDGVEAGVLRRVRLRVWAALIAGLRAEHEYVTQDVLFGDVGGLLASLESCFSQVDPALQGVAARRFWGLRLEGVTPSAVDAYIKDFNYYLDAITGDAGGLQNRAIVQNISEGIRHLRGHSEEFGEFCRQISVRTYDVQHRLVLQRLRYLARIDAQAAVLSGSSGDSSQSVDTLRTNTMGGTKRGKGKDKSGRKCYSCNSSKHLRPDCPHREAECKHCGRRGHIKGACRQLERERAAAKGGGGKPSGGGGTVPKTPLGPGNEPQIPRDDTNGAKGMTVTCGPGSLNGDSDSRGSTIVRPSEGVSTSHVQVYESTPPCEQALSASTSSTNQQLLADSGSSAHIVTDAHLLSACAPFTTTVTSFGGHKQNSSQRGTLSLRHGNRTLTLPKAVHAAGTESLLSVSQFCKQYQARFVFTATDCVAMTDSGKVLLTGKEARGVYQLNVLPVYPVGTNKVTAYGARVLDPPTDLVDRRHLETNKLVLLHHALGHLNYPEIRRMIKQRRLKVPLPVAELEVPPCTVCAVTTMSRRPYARIRKYQATRVGDLLVGDIKTVGVESIGKNTCFALFVDVRSTRVFFYPLRNVRGMLSAIERLKYEIKADVGEDLRALHLDADPHFNTLSFRLSVNKLGSQLLIASDGGHSEVALSERAIRTTYSRALRMLHHITGTPADVGRLWAVVMREAVFITNNLPTKSVHIPDGTTPSEVYFRSAGLAYTSDLTNVIPFGCPCAILKNKPNKLLSGQPDKAKIGMALGYEPAQRIYRVMNLDTNRVQYSRTVRLLPHRRFTTSKADAALGAILIQKLGGAIPMTLTRGRELLDDAYHEEHEEQPMKQVQTEGEQAPESGGVELSTPPPTDADWSSPPGFPGGTPAEEPIAEVGNDEVPWDDDSPLTIVRPSGETEILNPSTGSDAARSIRAMNIALAAHADPPRTIPVPEDIIVRIKVLKSELEGVKVHTLPCPQTFHEAIGIPRLGLLFAAAIKEEIDGINKNRVIDWYVEIPAGHKPVKTKWVFKWLSHGNGTFRRCKARLTACGYSQIYGIHFENTFAPTASLDAIRLVIAIACMLGLPLRHLDVKCAYHYGEFEKGVELYVKQPDGFVMYDNPRIGCKLLRPLYGTRQGGAAWDVVAHRELLNAGYTSCPMERCLYVSFDDDNKMVGLVVKVVDDFLFAGPVAEYRRLSHALGQKFEVVDMGDLDHFVGIDISHNLNTGVTTINQRGYAESILKRFFDEDIRPRDVPITTYNRSQLDRNIDDADLMKDSRYRELVGSLLYLATATRPDLLYAVCFYARFNDKHTLAHWKGLVDVCRYVRATLNYGIKFDKQLTERHLVAMFGDASHADWFTSRKSTYGYLSRLCGGAVSFRCGPTEVVCLSTTESEYVTLTHTGKAAAWLKGVSSFLGPSMTTALTDDAGIVIYVDNDAARRWAENSGFAARRNKHIDIRFRYVNELVTNGVVRLRRVDTTDNPADFLTKPLGQKRLKYLLDLIGCGPV
eukprot:CAMPEP_0119127524 /NCGR_PEP_ID=MMETSP1310-20130426/6037_1 /TAXON_ID=464262 /ORGANISM="Genus nov. species nov., Strain RCC2339" /LENGTH=1537 /DNA_ID=CAMNT_0007117795 /DNA_START=357 /DNA_END=4970 /DNA_ORIENTATION=+